MKIRIAAAHAVLLLTAVFLLRSWVFEELDGKAFDLLARWAGDAPISDRVVVVEIDEASVSQTGRWPWKRSQMAALIRRVLDAGAAVVALDLMFPSDPSGAAAGPSLEDAALADALKGQPVVVGYSFLFEGQPAGDPRCEVLPLPLVSSTPGARESNHLFRARGLICSGPQIAAATGDGGFLNAAPDPDGKYRRVPLVIEYGGAGYPSLALAAFRRYKRASVLRLDAGPISGSLLQLGELKIPLEDPGCLRLRFRGARRSFPYVSASRVLSGEAPAAALRDKIVLIGVTAAGLQDTISTPVDAVYPGIELHATAIDNLVRGDFFSRPGGAGIWELILALAAAVASTLVVGRFAWPLSGLIAAMTVAAAWATCAFAISTRGVLLSPIPASVVAVGQYSALSIVARRRDKRISEETARRLSSEKEHAQAALALSERRYRQLVENIHDAMAVSDLQGRLIFTNQKFREWFGIAEARIHEVRFEDCVAPEWRETLRDVNTRAAAGELGAAQCEFEGLRADGTKFWIEARFSNAEENSRITGTQSVLRDITSRKLIEAQYLQAQKMESIGRLAGGVAHDFNNLLTIINGFADVLLQSEPEGTETREGLVEISKAGLRAAELTSNLLAFSRSQRVKPRPLDFNLAVREALALCERLLGEDIEVITQMDPSGPRVNADPGQIHQVAMNLAVNARDSMAEGGRLVVSTSVVSNAFDLTGRPAEAAPGTYVCLEVSDTGAGMSEEVKLHLFEPFFTTKEQGKGTGLGLSTVYGIVSQAGGWVHVESEPGRGSRFLLYFPLAGGGEPVESAAPREAAPVRGTETVLLIEDQDAVRRLFTQILAEQGYRVLGAPTGPAAIEISEEYAGPIHLLLTDVLLPQMGGREVAERIRAMRPGIKVLFISGYVKDVSDPSASLEPGAAYLQKPCSPAELMAKLRETLAAGESE